MRTARKLIGFFSRGTAVPFVVALATFTAFSGEATAQGVGVGASLDVETITPKKIQGQFVYSVKFLCRPLPQRSDLLGFFHTEINIHNPNPGVVSFTKKAVETQQQGQPRGRVGKPVDESLNPNEGFGVDCGDIDGLLAPALTATGFVVITSPRELDVTAIYMWKNIETFPPGSPVGAGCIQQVRCPGR